MKRLSIIISLIFMLTGTVFAQDGWQNSGDGVTDFNCTTLNSALNLIGQGQSLDDLMDVEFVRSLDQTYTLQEYVGFVVLNAWKNGDSTTPSLEEVMEVPNFACAETASASDPTTVLFNVVVNGNANLRECAGTSCAIAGTAQAGDLLPVVAVDGDWYQVQRDGGTVFINAQLVSRGPDAVITLDEAHVDVNTSCLVAFDISRGDMDMNVIIAGEGRNDVVVDLFRPNESRPLTVEAQYDKTFSDTGDPYVHQVYQWNVGWPEGTYQLEIIRDDVVSRLAWERGERGDYNIFVVCS